MSQLVQSVSQALRLLKTTAIINVRKDAGIKGDGSNCTARLLALKTAAGAGATLYFPRGVYTIDASAFDGDINFAIVGESGGQVATAQASGSPAWGGATVLQFTNTTGDSLAFLGSAYLAGKISISNVLLWAATTGAVLRVDRVGGLALQDVTIINDGPSPAAGLRVSRSYYVDAVRTFIAKKSNQNVGTSTGLLIDKGAASSFLGGMFNFRGCSVQSWGLGAVFGVSPDTGANEQYATINWDGGEFLGNAEGAVFQAGVRSAQVRSVYCEANTFRGMSVVQGASNVEVLGGFFNNYGAGVEADIRFGINSGAAGNDLFYAGRVEGAYFAAVAQRGILVSGGTGAKVDIVRNRFRLGLTGAQAIVGGQAARPKQNTFAGFASASDELQGALDLSETIEDGTFTITSAQFTAAQSGTAKFSRQGNRVTVQFPLIQGTADGTATTFTLTGLPARLWPAANAPAMPCRAFNGNVSISTAVLGLDTAGVFTVSSQISDTGVFLGWNANGYKALYQTVYSYLLT